MKGPGLRRNYHADGGGDHPQAASSRTMIARKSAAGRYRDCRRPSVRRYSARARRRLQVGAAPREPLSAELHDEQVGHQPRMATVAVREGMNLRSLELPATS